MPQHRKKDYTSKDYLSLSVYLYLLLYDCRVHSIFCPDLGLNPRRWGTSAMEAKVLTTGPPVVPYTSGIGAGVYSTVSQYKYLQFLLLIHCNRPFNASILLTFLYSIAQAKLLEGNEMHIYVSK